VSARREFLAGIRDLGPVLISIFPIGVVLAIAAVDTGFTAAQAVWLAVGVYTGLAQAAMLELLNDGAPVVVVVATGILVNLRLVMYSASLAPYFRERSLGVRAAAGFFNLDAVYALAVARFAGDGPENHLAYYLGAGISAWIVWVAGTVAGLAFGDFVPEGLNIRFAIPLVFIALLVPVLKDRPSVAAAAAAGVVGVLAAGLPFDLGLIVGTVAGIAVGTVSEGWWT
jgi:predicted branched-subunit amino acid permease